MSWRTPSALKWLIVKRSRISGTLAWIEARKTTLLNELESLNTRAAGLSQDLVAVDRAMGLHTIQVCPDQIRPVRPQTRGRLVPLGGLGGTLTRCLRSAGADWRSTSELTAAVEALVREELTPDRHHYVRLAVRRRLRNMLRAGSVERRWQGNENGKPDGNSEAWWRLVPGWPHYQRPKR